MHDAGWQTEAGNGSERRSSMISVVILSLQALAGSAAAAPQALFAPDHCAYQVNFPVPVTLQEAPGAEGHHSVSAEILNEKVRFAAACLATPASRHPATVSALPAITAIAQALGVRDATVKALASLGPECGSAEGALGSAYRIEAKLCVTPGATFIAETIYRSQQKNPAVAMFLASVSRKAIPSKPFQ